VSVLNCEISASGKFLKYLKFQDFMTSEPSSLDFLPVFWYVWLNYKYFMKPTIISYGP